ncbi:hypothetical protein Cob_v005681 [Colletotrichum orbiculare MAFF 240422]|uniref:Uncharacterized protein n=1 Tax=Colletotrichum orbiculare (strain 104-T / ATCC 96160 / CBS 514.97 / LARS 414 / MAFF 240422) TaxID=1213857 RepID=A0A484FTR8_COLOR|nr:hypothetical protein Cob_v005681 [Colletotrichum orbiculare MAFF 240422]
MPQVKLVSEVETLQRASLSRGKVAFKSANASEFDYQSSPASTEKARGNFVVPVWTEEDLYGMDRVADLPPRPYIRLECSTSSENSLFVPGQHRRDLKLSQFNSSMGSRTPETEHYINPLALNPVTGSQNTFNSSRPASVLHNSTGNRTPETIHYLNPLALNPVTGHEVVFDYSQHSWSSHGSETGSTRVANLPPRPYICLETLSGFENSLTVPARYLHHSFQFSGFRISGFGSSPAHEHEERLCETVGEHIYDIDMMLEDSDADNVSHLYGDENVNPHTVFSPEVLRVDGSWLYRPCRQASAFPAPLRIVKQHTPLCEKADVELGSLLAIHNGSPCGFTQEMDKEYKTPGRVSDGDAREHVQRRPLPPLPISSQSDDRENGEHGRNEKRVRFVSGITTPPRLPLASIRGARREDIMLEYEVDLYSPWDERASRMGQVVSPSLGSSFEIYVDPDCRKPQTECPEYSSAAAQQLESETEASLDFLFDSVSEPSLKHNPALDQNAMLPLRRSYGTATEVFESHAGVRRLRVVNPDIPDENDVANSENLTAVERVVRDFEAGKYNFSDEEMVTAKPARAYAPTREESEISPHRRQTDLDAFTAALASPECYNLSALDRLIADYENGKYDLPEKTEVARTQENPSTAATATAAVDKKLRSSRKHRRSPSRILLWGLKIADELLVLCFWCCLLEFDLARFLPLLTWGTWRGASDTRIVDGKTHDD